MRKGWQTVKLGEVAEIPSENIDTNKILLSQYVSTENMINNRGGIELNDKPINLSRVRRFKKQDILFSNIRTYFKKVWYASFDGGCSNDVIVFQATNNIHSRYLYYIISSDEFINYTVVSAKGTKMPRGDKEAMKSHECVLPPLEEQERIASILSAFDDKIEVNNKICKDLEALAKLLFNNKFTANPNKDSWPVAKLGEVAEIIGGGTPSTSKPEYWDGDIPWISIKDFTGDIKYILSTEKSITQLGLHNSSTKILQEGDIIISARGTVGELAQIIKPMAFNQSCYGIRTKLEGNHNFLYYTIKISIKELKNNAHGSVFDTITTNTIKELELPLPPAELLAEFEAVVAPLFAQIKNLQQQNASLASTRDLLLPRLMKGEV